MNKDKYDNIIIGSGHNGLVCANYLAKQNQSVLILEARDVIGGAAVSEEVFPGYKFSRFSYVFSLFRQTIIDELFPSDWRSDLVLYKTDPALFVPTTNVDDFLVIGDDKQQNIANITRFASAKDAEGYYELMAKIQEISDMIEPLWDRAPVNSIFDIIKLLPKAKRPKRQGINEIIAFLTSSSSTILNQYLQNDKLKAALSYAGTVGQMLSPHTHGSAFLQLHHVANTIADPKNGYKYRYYPRGGNGAVSDYLAKLASEKGVEIMPNSPVDEILIADNMAYGVRLKSGEQVLANKVISNTTLDVVFHQLVSPKVDIPIAFNRGLQSIDYATNCSKINLVLSDVPNFTCLKNYINKDDDFATKREAAKAFMHNTLLAGDSMESLHDNYLAAGQKTFSKTPTIQILIPSLMDDTLTPDGSTDIVALLFVQYTPYDVEGGWSKENKAQFLDNVFNTIEQYAPGFKASIKHTDALFPPDIEKVLNLTGGNIFHGSMNLGSIYTTRPMPTYNQYKTPIDNLYTCSAANHPGGGVCGGTGRNCAKAILKE